jgi:hypothetical protein
VRQELRRTQPCTFNGGSPASIAGSFDESSGMNLKKVRVIPVDQAIKLIELLLPIN